MTEVKGYKREFKDTAKPLTVDFSTVMRRVMPKFEELSNFFYNLSRVKKKKGNFYTSVWKFLLLIKKAQAFNYAYWSFCLA